MKKFSFSFGISLIVFLSVFLSGNTTTLASETTIDDQQEFEKHIQIVTQEAKELNRDFDIFEKLTDEDYVKMLPKIQKLESENPNLSEEELNELAYNLFLEEYENGNNNLITPFYISIGGANSQEVALCVRHPIRCTKARSDATTANNQTSAYYSSGFLNGNADAFRHAYWNNLMVKSIGDIPAAEFANAHEYGAKNQPIMQRDMDLHNNQLGRHAF